jgi:GntR family transcriptional regulator
MALAVSRSRATPLHDQIRRAIHAQIASGELPPGARLPTEQEYAESFGVSIAPVRQALLDLVASGYLVRVKGRGTFVREAKVEEAITLLASFTDGLRARAEKFAIRVLALEIEPADDVVRAELGLRSREPVVALRRVAEVRGEPAALLDAYLPADRFGRLVRFGGWAEGRSLYRTLEEAFATRVGQARSTLEVIRCDDDQADLLGVAVGAPALLVRSVTDDVDGVHVEAAHVVYRADRFTFTIDSHR